MSSSTQTRHTRKGFSILCSLCADVFLCNRRSERPKMKLLWIVPNRIRGSPLSIDQWMCVCSACIQDVAWYNYLFRLLNISSRKTEQPKSITCKRLWGEYLVSSNWKAIKCLRMLLSSSTLDSYGSIAYVKQTISTRIHYTHSYIRTHGHASAATVCLWDRCNENERNKFNDLDCNLVPMCVQTISMRTHQSTSMYWIVHTLTHARVNFTKNKCAQKMGTTIAVAGVTIGNTNRSKQQQQQRNRAIWIVCQSTCYCHCHASQSNLCFVIYSAAVNCLAERIDHSIVLISDRFAWICFATKLLIDMSAMTRMSCKLSHACQRTPYGNRYYGNEFVNDWLCVCDAIHSIWWLGNYRWFRARS